MFGWLKKSKPDLGPRLNFESLAVDLHSHVLPGIDDGAKTIGDSVILIKKMMSLGIRKVIATPHIMRDYYRNTPERINHALNILKGELARQQIAIPVEAAAEYFFDEYFIDLVQKGEPLLTMGQGKYILTEFSFISAPPVFIPIIQNLIGRGIQPILAHPERYPYYTIDQYRNARDWGCNLQLNTISLTGYYGKEAKKIAEELIDNQLVDFIASDMHHPRHAEALAKSLEMPYVQKLLKDYPLKNSLLL